MSKVVEPSRPAARDGRLAWILAGLGPTSLLVLLVLPSTRAELIGPRLGRPATLAADEGRTEPNPGPARAPSPSARQKHQPAVEPRSAPVVRAEERALEAGAAGRFLEQAYLPLLPASASALRVSLAGGRVRIAATIDPERLKRELRAPLPDIVQSALVTGLAVDLAGQLSDGPPGRVRLAVEEARIGALPIPLDLVHTMLAAESGARGIEAAEGTVLSLPLPAGVARLRLDGDRLLVQAADGG